MTMKRGTDECPEQRPGPDEELALDKETLRDLDASNADAIGGGASVPRISADPGVICGPTAVGCPTYDLNCQRVAVTTACVAKG